MSDDPLPPLHPGPYAPGVERDAAAFHRQDLSDPVAARLGPPDAVAPPRAFDRNVEEVEREIPGGDGQPLTIRLYLHRDRPVPAPCFLNFHGGGFFAGDLETEHLRCVRMSGATRAVSIGVDYRLAPEHPFPAGLDDCEAALRWVHGHAAELGVDPERIVIGGCSAGGNLTAAVALRVRDRGGPPIALQMLLYPVIDDGCDTASMRSGDATHVWTRKNALDSWDLYLGPAAGRGEVSPYAAPVRATELAGLPPAYVTTCDHDPLRDEGLAYATRLIHAGVPTELHHYPGTVHGFDVLTATAVAEQALAEGEDAFRRATAP